MALESAFVLIFAGQMPRGITNIGAFFGLFMSLAALLITVFFGRVKTFLKKLWKRKSGKVFLICFSSVFGRIRGGSFFPYDKGNIQCAETARRGYSTGLPSG